MKKIYCEICKTKYDANQENCPYCHSRNNFLDYDFNKTNLINISFKKQLLLFVIGLVGLSLFAAIFTFAFTNIKIDDNLKLAIINTLAYVFAFSIMCCVLNNDIYVIFNQFKNSKIILYGILGLTAILIFSNVYQMILVSTGFSFTSNENQQAIVNIATQYPLLTFAFSVLLGPIFEELAYRVGLFSLINRKSRLIAYIVSVLIFAFLHFNPLSKNIVNELIMLPEYIISGLVLTYVYEKKGLGASFTCHLLNNIIAFLLIYTQI